jgi:hypothetical protein
MPLRGYSNGFKTGSSRGSQLHTKHGQGQVIKCRSDTKEIQVSGIGRVVSLQERWEGSETESISEILLVLIRVASPPCGVERQEAARASSDTGKKVTVPCCADSLSRKCIGIQVLLLRDS